MADDEKDPFEFFAHSTGSGIVRNPYPRFAELRAQCPVHQGTAGALFGIPTIDQAAFSETGAYYTACSYAAVAQVLLDGETFSSAGYGKTMGLVMGHSILEMDEPEHHRYRNLLQQAFSQKAMDRWERDLVAPVVARCIDRFVDRGRADLVRELTFPFPLQVIAGMLGLPDQDLPRFHRLAVELISIAVAIERGIAASQQLRDYFAEILAARRAQPGDDLVSVLAQAELDGPRLTDEEIFAFLSCFPPARRPRTARRATCSTVCSPIPTSWRRCATIGRSCAARWRRDSGGRRRSRASRGRRRAPWSSTASRFRPAR
jgi:cytochrome P450